MRHLGHRLVSVLGAAAFTCLGVAAAHAAPPLVYAPTQQSLQLHCGQSSALSLWVGTKNKDVTALAPTVAPVSGFAEIPAAWVSAAPGQATFAKAGATFIITIAVPVGAPAGVYCSSVGVHVIAGSGGTDGDGCTVTLTVVNDPPQAGFSCLPATPTTADVVSFTDASSDPDGTIVAWAWNFGDGTGSNERHPTHAFAAPGDYVVALVVTDDCGANGSSALVVTVGETPPEPVVQEPLILSYGGSRLAPRGSPLRLSTSAFDLSGQDESSQIGSLVSFIVLDLQWRVAAEPQATQAGPATAPGAEISVAPGVYQVYVNFPGDARFLAESAGPELVVVSPGEGEALAAWGSLEDGGRQFGLLVAFDEYGRPQAGQFVCRDAETGDEVTSASVDSVTCHAGVWRVSGVCSANDVHGYEFWAELAPVDGAWALTFEVSNGVAAQGVLDPSSAVLTPSS
ncbi:MAG TPA: PKD domain-containing protein [Armatimonadota bacterium]|nr:PKD domain-containing protein [Armatimonadota bacterium]